MLTIHPEVFRAYMRAGALWPQLRGPLSCAIVDSAAKTQPAVPLTALLATRLGPGQLKESADTVHRLHRRFGIPERGPIDHDELQHEWVKSLNAVAFVHLVALGLAPDAVYDGYADYLTDAGPALAGVSRDGTFRRTISAMCAAHDTFASSKQLARTFKFTFTGHGPARSPREAARIRIDCMDEIRHRLEARLTGHDPTVRQALAMGLDSLSYQRARAGLTSAGS
ncbi:hypothetical protein [Streptomyces sp. M92]|uniref:hypothetical protein n=1 Tax=Streptomyces sp. M92 TaxID=2944250 RepID=UPI00234B87E9|nr:hypothetical protein [Streptomyces sp. M92]WCN07398.1 hypothetical protein M6G08_35760 [Streptomyces sp. M92]